MSYDHRRHAGNAGDLWKHLLLAEVADRLLAAGVRVYVESHAGRSEYQLLPGGEWEGGIGRLWPPRGDLTRYSYFVILGGLNPGGLMRYPGSATIVLEIARVRGIDLRMELWDKSPEVEGAWRRSRGGGGGPEVQFHLGDGFSGASRLVEELRESALLLIDSPFVDEEDAALVDQLMGRAAEAGWAALSWHPVGGRPLPTPRSRHRTFALDFNEADLDGCGMEGVAMVLAWGDRTPGGIEDLVEGLVRIEEEFARLARRLSQPLYL
jgi:23S rRNA (adenine2030-N6)-methyltransferase